MHLTDQKLLALPFEEGQRDYTDDAVGGLSIRVGKRSKTFMLIIGKGSARRRVKVGQYPDLALAQAREKARDLLAEARMTKEQPRAATFEGAFQQYKSVHVPTMRPGSQKHCVRLLTSRFTALHKRKLDGIKTAELAEALDAIKAPGERLNAFIWLRAFFNWCYRREYIDRNPVSRLKAPAGSQTRERVLSNSELVRVWTGSSEGTFGAYIRLLILTAQRKGQWLQSRPEFIEGNTIHFPAGVMKGKRPHSIPLTPLIAETIGDYRFQGFNESRHKRELLKRSQTSGWTLHDLRRTAATRMAEMGVSPHVIERLLAHAMPGVAARYNRASYHPEMREALHAWQRYIEGLLSDKESTSLREAPCGTKGVAA